MTAAASPAAAFERPSFRLTPHRVAVVSITALAWAGVIAYASDMGNGAGTMGMAFVPFLAMWSSMMTAMMLPAVAPVAALYLRTIGVSANRGRRMTVFIAGYLVVWVAFGIPAYVALRIIDDHVGQTGMRVIAVVLLAVAGVYQLTPLKSVCLRHCRSPLGQLLHYGNMKGRARDLRVAVHHAAFCLGCCWALMALFVAFGVMSIWAMVGLAAVVISEKLLRTGELIGRIAGVVFIALALLVAVSPRVADAVVPDTSSMPSMPAMP